MTNPLHVEALKNCHHNLVETIAELHFLTVSAPRNAEWDQVRDKISSLDSIADAMRQALDTWPGSPTSYAR